LFELGVWLETVGRSLIAVFIPVLLLKVGFSIPNIILFFFLFNFFDVPLNLVARWLVIHVGAMRTITLAIFAEIVYFLFLYFAKLDWFTFLGLALSWAVYDSFYWVAHWFVFNECVKVRQGTGKQVSTLAIIRRFGGLISPGVGAAFLVFLSKDYLIVITILFFIAALIPLSRMKLTHKKPSAKRNVFSFFRNKTNKLNCISIFFHGLHEQTEGVLFPLFIFVVFQSIESVGALPMVAAVASIIFTFYIGRLSDKFDKNKLIMLGCFIGLAVWVTRLSFPTLSVAYMSVLVTGLLSVIINVPLDSKLIEAGKKANMLNMSTYRNVIYMFANVVLYGVLYFATSVFLVSFTVAAAGLIVLGLMSKFIMSKYAVSK